MRNDERRHRFDAKQARRCDPAVPGDDALLGVDQHRIDEPEPPDRLRDLLYLSLGMGARVTRLRPELADRQHNDRLPLPRRGKAWICLWHGGGVILRWNVATRDIRRTYETTNAQ